MTELVDFNVQTCRGKFVEFLCKRFWDGLFPEYKHGSFEKELPHLAARVKWVENKPAYIPAKFDGHGPIFRHLQQDWEMWETAWDASHQYATDNQE